MNLARSATLPFEAGHAAARIGPNAITRVAEALQRRFGPEGRRVVFAQAGLGRYLESPPQEMVDEREVIALHGTLRDELGDAEAAAVALEAGRLTALYLLAHRIPRPVQALLQRLPAPLAARVLLRAITAHAWTFAGSGRFSAAAAPLRSRAGARVTLRIEDNPLCRGRSSAVPCCDYYAAVFGTLFAALVHPQAVVRETACEARGDGACVFEVGWD